MSPKARVISEADPEAASRLAAWAKEVTAGEFDEAAKTFRVTEGKEDLFRTAAKLAGVELGWQKSSNPGALEGPTGTRQPSEKNPGAEYAAAPSNAQEEEGPGKPGLPAAAILVGVGLASLLAWAASRPSA
ncbi:MAG: hypothetical protein QME70_09640 [Bacillota bacterium]|nr:hypothetical protein [Bacillota bacterium]